MSKPLDPQAREHLAQAIFGAPPRTTWAPPTMDTHEHFLMAFTNWGGSHGPEVPTLPGAAWDDTYRHAVDLADIEYMASGAWQWAQA